jgi:hypothetical protein
MNFRNLPIARWIVQVLCMVGLSTLFLPAASAQSNTANFATLDTYIQAQMQAMNLPGLALGIVRRDQVVYLMGYGLADPSGWRPRAHTGADFRTLGARAEGAHGFRGADIARDYDCLPADCARSR